MAEVGAADLAALLLELYPRLIKELRCGMEAGGPACITLPQWRILSFLAEEPATNKALAEAVGVSVAATSRMVDGLLERGLLLRTKDNADKRQAYLGLSPEGRKQVLAFRRSAEKTLVKKLKKLAPEELSRAAFSLQLLTHTFAPSRPKHQALRSDDGPYAGQRAPTSLAARAEMRFKGSSASASRLR